MKKLLTLFFTIAVALAMGAPVFAAPSAQSGLNPTSVNAKKKKKAKKAKKAKKSKKSGNGM